MTGLGATLPPALRSAIVWTLHDQGFPQPDAEAWADGWACSADPSVVLAQAVAFDDHGVPLDQAIEWHRLGFYAAEATCFYDAHYRPDQAAVVCDLAEDDADADEWVATGLPADRAIAYLKAGVGLDELSTFEAHGAGTSDVLGMLAGLLC